MIAVLNADLVGSTRLTPEDYTQTIADIEDYLQGLKHQHNVIYSLYRGDEFQVAFEHPEAAVTTLLKLKLWLASANLSHPLQSTISLAYGPGELTGEDPGKANGETFILAGRTLDKMRPGQLAINLLHKETPALTVICQQLSYILNRLNTSQTTLLYDYVYEDFPTHQNLADKLATSRQNISERLSAAGADLLPGFIDYMNNLIQQQMQKEK
ncbi:nucleotidyl cyclase domain-containing protein [Salinimonas chungwhensis]|uniref:hypothetical protein n=1 Tax=Salinimonas chungwhensis TaxID=265425 RepID=UPI00036C670F|nr:hypothetical protein [Salinimonas chungwhensis]